MRKQAFFIFLFCVLATSGNCQGQCDIRGTWLIKKGRITPNYQRTAYEYSENRVTFGKDRIELASGFFYSILALDSNDWALGRYPFVYYGRTEDYRIVNDSLQIFRRPYGEWDSFKLKCVNTNQILLVKGPDTTVLVRSRELMSTKNCSIKSIRAHIYEQGLGLYGNDYKVTYSIDDKLAFQQLSEKAPKTEIRVFQMKTGTFQEICGGLSLVDFGKLKRRYQTGDSEVEVKEVAIEFLDGRTLDFHLENDDYPEDLMLALIPVLYGHQQYVYRDLPAIK